MYWSYNLGTKAIDILTANAKEFTGAASMLGVFIVGALTSNYGGTTVATVIENGDSPIVIQSILDGVLPKLIPLALTLGLFFLMKNWKPVTCIALLLVNGMVGAFLVSWLNSKLELQCTLYFLILMGRCSLIPAFTWRRGQIIIMNCIPKSESP